ncbi:P21 protein [Arracacha virus 1]|uniref:P21 protein n=1 Tax=Arracacha virus 1 TaxID=2201042 RepID=A0A2U8JHB2_9CLOS|nr:P21 protein [Arracacha virus 1]AWK68099.1 P21 protein [Arracacha virus 1]
MNANRSKLGFSFATCWNAPDDKNFVLVVDECKMFLLQVTEGSNESADGNQLLVHVLGNSIVQDVESDRINCVTEILDCELFSRYDIITYRIVNVYTSTSRRLRYRFDGFNKTTQKMYWRNYVFEVIMRRENEQLLDSTSIEYVCFDETASRCESLGHYLRTAINSGYSLLSFGVKDLRFAT